jgi:hypothetical protein
MARVQDRNMQLLNISIYNHSLYWFWIVLNDNTSERDNNQHSNHPTNMFKAGKSDVMPVLTSVLDTGLWSASRCGDFTVRETTIPRWTFYMLGSWRCAPGLVCPVTFTKGNGDTSEYEQRDSHESVLHKRSRLRGKNKLTTVVSGSNKTQREFFHEISTANQMVPQG